MNPLDWIRARLSQRGNAMSLYRRGMRKAKLHDHDGAIADYTAVIDMAGAGANVRSMALYNRSLVYAATDHNANAVQDLETLLEMPAAAPNVKTEARRQLLRMDRTADRLEERTRGHEA